MAIIYVPPWLPLQRAEQGVIDHSILLKPVRGTNV